MDSLISNETETYVDFECREGDKVTSRARVYHNHASNRKCDCFYQMLGGDSVTPAGRGHGDVTLLSPGVWRNNSVGRDW
jgi:hypothetical protein